MPLSNAEKQAVYRERRSKKTSHAIDQIKTVLADLVSKEPAAQVHAELISKYLDEIR